MDNSNLDQYASDEAAAHDSEIQTVPISTDECSVSETAVYAHPLRSRFNVAFRDTKTLPNKDIFYVEAPQNHIHRKSPCVDDI